MPVVGIVEVLREVVLPAANGVLVAEGRFVANIVEARVESAMCAEVANDV